MKELAYMEKKVNLWTQFYNPRISQNDKIFGLNGPKFQDLYASIYGR